MFFWYCIIAVIVFVHTLYELNTDYTHPVNNYEYASIFVYCLLRAVLWFIIVPYMIRNHLKDWQCFSHSFWNLWCLYVYFHLVLVLLVWLLWLESLCLDDLFCNFNVLDNPRTKGLRWNFICLLHLLVLSYQCILRFDLWVGPTMDLKRFVCYWFLQS